MGNGKGMGERGRWGSKDGEQAIAIDKGRRTERDASGAVSKVKCSASAAAVRKIGTDRVIRV